MVIQVGLARSDNLSMSRWDPEIFLRLPRVLWGPQIYDIPNGSFCTRITRVLLQKVASSGSFEQLRLEGRLLSEIGRIKQPLASFEM